MSNSHNNRFRILRQCELGLPFYSLSEEIANAITHGLGVMFAVVSAILLIKASPKDFYSLLCVCVYEGAIFILYVVSTLYHALGLCRAKKVFRILDHCSIFLSIAGTYTPVCFFKMGQLGRVLLIVIWSVAFIGIALNSIDLKNYARFSMVCYVVMGWAVIFTIKPLVDSLTVYQLYLLVGGGIAYTLGILFYVFGGKIRYFHSLWHVFVLLGSAVHFVMIYSFFN